MQVNRFSSRFCLVKDVFDVIKTLGVPVEYALKVDAGAIEDEVVKYCLSSTRFESAHTVLFRLTYTAAECSQVWVRINQGFARTVLGVCLMIWLFIWLSVSCKGCDLVVFMINNAIMSLNKYPFKPD